MLITFSSKAWNNITMFGDVALTLLKMMGHSGTVPGALLAHETPAALVRLEQALDTLAPQTGDMQNAPSTNSNPHTTPPVELRLRAYPLIQLLSASVQRGCDVTWRQDHLAV